MNDRKAVDEHKYYNCVLTDGGKLLLLNWKKVEILSTKEFRDAVEAFAGHCKIQKPTRAIIDARGIDPNSAALGWVSGQESDSEAEEYMAWWAREVMPTYNDSGISSLAVATGNPKAPGETPAPPSASFKTGYFDDLESAMSWLAE